MPSSACKTCARSEEHTSELQSHSHLVCRLLLEKKKIATRAAVHSASCVTSCVTEQTRPRPASTPCFPALLADGLPQLTLLFSIFFFFNDTATTEIYTLSLHDALPIYTSELQSYSHLVCRLTGVQTC